MESPEVVRPGVTLDNGAVVIAVRGDRLVAVRDHSHEPYCVWSFRQGSLGSTFWGHYFENLRLALDEINSLPKRWRR